ncbi:hypothetical protein D9M68_895160 [compost metagenome]
MGTGVMVCMSTSGLSVSEAGWACIWPPMPVILEWSMPAMPEWSMPAICEWSMPDMPEWSMPAILE